MHLDDQEKIASITDRGIFCYKAMLFGLKNVKATYQRLVNKMFADLLDNTIEVYIDYMLFKLFIIKQYFDQLHQAFDILVRYNMKFNPTKYSFDMALGKFIGYMVTQWGIKAKPNQI